MTPVKCERSIRGYKSSQLADLTFEGITPPMSVYVKQNSIDDVLAIIELHLIQVDGVLNLSRKMNEQAIKIVASDLYEILYPCSFQELTKFFKNYRSGKYCSLYQGINSENACNAARKFIDGRTMYFGKRSTNESNQMKVRRTREENGVDLTVEEIKERINARFNIDKNEDIKD